MGTVIHLAFPTVIALLLLSVAISFAVRPTERKLGVLRPLSLALVFALISTIFGGFANVLWAAVNRTSFPEGRDSVHLMLNGLAEGMVPGMVGFAILGVVWGLAALGLKRQT